MNLRQIFWVFYLYAALFGARFAWADDTGSAVVKSNTALALDMYRQLETDTTGMIFSPYSISTALAMTYAGARENTELQMTKTMHITIGHDKFHQTSGELSQKLEDNAQAGGYDFLIANSLWFQLGYDLQKDFRNIQEKTYKAAPKEVDFASNPEAQRVSINRWVEEKTKSRIKDLIASGMITDMTRLVLVNALYFKGKWATKFDVAMTREEDFSTALGKKIKVHLMNQTTELLYGEYNNIQVLAMPYVANKFSMIFILPRINTLSDLEKNLTSEKLDQYIKELQSEKVNVTIPKFRLETALVLNDKLKSLGMTDAFDGNLADFSGMDGQKDLYISYVIHKAFVEVDESGSEAAAASAVALTWASMPKEESQPKVFRADHPFIFLLRDNETGSIIFMGRVIDPNKN